MRRTTISRSKRAALLALVAVPLVAVGLSAQDTSKVAVPAPPPATPDTTLGTALPATHTVTQGETLWSISQMYFQDPLLWPEIFRLNTSAVEDPHWIYPGQVLTIGGEAPAVAEAPPPAPVAQGTPTSVTHDTMHVLPTGADTVAAAPVAPESVAVAPVDTTSHDTTQAVAVEPPPPPPPPPVEEEAYETVFDRPHSPRSEVQSVLDAYAHQPYRPVRRGEFYSAGFLTEHEQLPWGEVVGINEAPAIPRLTTSTTAYQFDQIVVEPPHGASYHVNDSLLIVSVPRSEGPWGDVVVPTGVARVVEVAQHQLLAELVDQFGAVHGGQRVLPLEPFKDPGEVRPTPIDQGLLGHVIAQRDPTEVATSSQQVVFIDRGTEDGVVPGDVFEIFTGHPGMPSSEHRATLEIVHTRDRTASGILLQIDNPEIKPGLPVRLIRKMPS